MESMEGDGDKCHEGCSHESGFDKCISWALGMNHFGKGLYIPVYNRIASESMKSYSW